MERLRKFYLYIKGKYELLSLKKYTTIAGTLVFFLIMSIVPLSFWLTLLIGKLPIDTENLLSLGVFDSVKHVLSYIRREAANATGSTSVVLIFTTLYASTNLFYQMRRSGELIYDFHRERQGLRLRLGALVLLVIVMLTTVAFLLVFAIGSFLFARLFSRPWALIADYALLAGVAFFLALLLNVYVCPYKTSARAFLPGTFLTVSAWAVAFIGFSVYLKISNVGKLYGALSAIIVFLLWLYILMICFIVGVIFNSERIHKERKRAVRKARRKKSVA
ncbi:MAG: YihY/virulence factor BrkB family protein [Clostridia bacterium]|nr:YihY/virulence factor BrkB family protein [Clostridia bacterium]